MHLSSSRQYCTRQYGQKSNITAQKNIWICITGRQYKPVIFIKKKKPLSENMHSNYIFVNNEHSVPDI